MFMNFKRIRILGKFSLNITHVAEMRRTKILTAYSNFKKPAAFLFGDT
jgi:hypothetical protein